MGLAYRLINETRRFRLLYQLRKLLSNRDYLILNVCFELLLFLFKSMAEFEIFLKCDVKLASQVFDILGCLVLLHVAEV